ncbi:hypothetical protein BH20ACT12_BH20ACT12_17910 [soil metagenome]|nr:hypothetical protein [Rubrobacteraceae bacterium]
MRISRISRGETLLGKLSFTNIHEVYKPTRTGAPNVVEAPEDIVGWFLRHPYLDTTEPEPTMVGGVEGVQFDVIVEDLPGATGGMPDDNRGGLRGHRQVRRRANIAPPEGR